LMLWSALSNPALFILYLQCTVSFGPQADCWCCEAHVECMVETSNVGLLLAVYGFPLLLLRT